MIDFDTIKMKTPAELHALGFRVWNKESNDENELLWLIPVKYFEQIPIGIELETIGGYRIEFDTDASQDTRFGMLGFGFRRMIEPGE